VVILSHVMVLLPRANNSARDLLFDLALHLPQSVHLMQLEWSDGAAFAHESLYVRISQGRRFEVGRSAP
jgi:hypothetical protein